MEPSSREDQMLRCNWVCKSRSPAFLPEVCEENPAYRKNTFSEPNGPSVGPFEIGDLTSESGTLCET